MSTTIPYVTDERTGIAIVRPNNPGFFMPRLQGIGTITYRCHSCGELIPKMWEAFFYYPVTGWAAPFVPAVMPETMTTHHAWHMELAEET